MKHGDASDERAVALRYERGESAPGESGPGSIGSRQLGRGAPQVVAKGRGETAAQIRELANAHGVACVEDSDLVELLDAVELFETIPEELFNAVAEVLAFLYRVNEGLDAAR